MNKTKSKENCNDMRQTILAAAQELMTEKGIGETSLKDIARSAKISAGTLYYYYSAKEDIIFDIAESNMRQITDELVGMIDGDPPSMTMGQVLQNVFKRILQEETRGKLHLYLISLAASKNGTLTERFREQYRQWRSTIESSLIKLRIPGNPAAAAYLILAAIDGLIIQNTFAEECVPICEIIQNIF